MAQIDIEKKKNPIWPWLLLGILIVAALIVFIDDDDDIEQDQVVATQTEEVESADTNEDLDDNQEVNNEIQAYVSYIEKNGKEVGLKHTYSSNALTRLATALETVASKHHNVQANEALNQLKQNADELTKNRDSGKHADIMSRAFTNAADVMKQIQQTDYPDLENEIREVEEAAQAIDPKAMATEQDEAINRFFTESADALKAINEQTENV